MGTIIEGRLLKAIEDAEQMLVVCEHAGAKVPMAVVRVAAQLRATLDATKAATNGVGRRVAAVIPAYLAPVQRAGGTWQVRGEAPGRHERLQLVPQSSPTMSLTLGGGTVYGCGTKND